MGKICEECALLRVSQDGCRTHSLARIAATPRPRSTCTSNHALVTCRGGSAATCALIGGLVRGVTPGGSRLCRATAPAGRAREEAQGVGLRCGNCECVAERMTACARKHAARHGCMHSADNAGSVVRIVAVLT